MLHEHHADWAFFDGNTVRLQGGEQHFFLLDVVALIGEVADKIERFFPRLQRAHRTCGELLDRAEYALDDAMLVAQDLRRLLCLMSASASMNRGRSFSAAARRYCVIPTLCATSPYSRSNSDRVSM